MNTFLKGTLNETEHYEKEITLLSVSSGFPTLILIQQLANKLKNVNKNRHGQVQKNLSLLQSSVPFPSPPGVGLNWFLQVPPGGARAEQEHSTNISTKSKKEQLREQEQKGNSDIE